MTELCYSLGVYLTLLSWCREKLQKWGNYPKKSRDGFVLTIGSYVYGQSEYKLFELMSPVEVHCTRNGNPHEIRTKQISHSAVRSELVVLIKWIFCFRSLNNWKLLSHKQLDPIVNVIIFSWIRLAEWLGFAFAGVDSQSLSSFNTSRCGHEKRCVFDPRKSWKNFSRKPGQDGPNRWKISC